MAAPIFAKPHKVGRRLYTRVCKVRAVCRVEMTLNSGRGVSDIHVEAP